MAEPARTWQIKDARANFSTLVDKAISDGSANSDPQWKEDRRRLGRGVGAPQAPRRRPRPILCQLTAARRGPGERTLGGLPARDRVLTDYLLDTNVISELVRPSPDANVVAWVRAADETCFYLSVLSFGE